MGKNDCHFHSDWTKTDKDGNPLFPDLYPWIKECDGDQTRASCSWCKKVISIKNSGIIELRSHMKSGKHVKEENARKGNQSTVFKQFQVSAAATKTSNPAGVVVESNNNHPVESRSGSQNNQVSFGVCTCGLKSQNASLNNFIIKDEVTQAEIYLALVKVFKNGSLRLLAELCKLFPFMFKDSEIARKINMHEDKLAYVITYGLGPFFQTSNADTASKSKYIAASMDESLNKIAKKSQMDLVIRFCRGDGLVETRYLTSVFLQGSKASDLLDAFKTAITGLGLNLRKLINVSMDGPNVNKKFLEDLKADLRADPASTLKLVDFGSCALHVVNNSFKSGHKASGWEIQKFLRKQYYFFKDFPSRRGAYTAITGSSEFPIPFCGTRWVENGPGLQRTIDILPSLRKYFNASAKNPPKSEIYNFLKEFIRDKFLPTKLYFMLTISQELEKFLTKYQSNKPLLPFLHHDLYTMLRNLFKRVVKTKKMEKVRNANDLLSINLNDEENLRSPAQVDLGFGATREIKKFKENAESLILKKECKKFIIEVCKKILVKSPIKSAFVMGASCLSPFVMTNISLAESRLDKALTTLIDHDIFTPSEGERIKGHYVELLEKQSVQRKLEIFDQKEDSLDKFLLDICKEEKTSEIVIEFIQVILIMFHGNAAVERSFSYNKKFLVENLQEDSLIAQRAVHDHIINTPGGIKNIKITQQMISAFRNSSSKRKEALAKKKLEADVEQQKRKQALANLKEFRLKKQKALDCAKIAGCEAMEYDREINKLQDSLHKMR